MKNRIYALLLFMGIVLPLCLGQVCGVVPNDPARLEVTDTLREACPDYDDARILTKILIVDDSRSGGVLRRENALATSLVYGCCVGYGCAEDEADCVNCTVAVYNQVWPQ